jgi:hypothetical protein
VEYILVGCSEPGNVFACNGVLSSGGHKTDYIVLQRLFGDLILSVTYCHQSAGHCASMDSLRTNNLDILHPIPAEVILKVFDKRLLVPSQPLGIVA